MRTADEIRHEAMERDNKCYSKAQARGQLTFTVVEQDASAVETAAYWLLKNANTAPQEKLQAALDFILMAREFPNKKNAD